jgi:hypothetical protein
MSEIEIRSKKARARIKFSITRHVPKVAGYRVGAESPRQTLVLDVRARPMRCCKSQHRKHEHERNDANC